MTARLREMAAMAVVYGIIALTSAVVIGACVALLPVRWIIEWDANAEVSDRAGGGARS